jgi:hypothetical protein
MKMARDSLERLGVAAPLTPVNPVELLGDLIDQSAAIVAALREQVAALPAVLTADGTHPLFWLYGQERDRAALLFATLFITSWLAQSITGWRDYNADQQSHGEVVVSFPTYLHQPDFWDRTLQNWQSEFLAVGAMAIFAVYLRQRGSPESKVVGAPHSETPE